MHNNDMEASGKQNPQPGLPAVTKNTISRGQKWLLLEVLALGWVWSWLWCDSDGTVPGLLIGYGLFWLIYLGIFHLVCWEKAKQRPGCFLLAAAAALVCLLNALQGWYGSSQGLFGLPLFNLLAIPCMLMLHAQAVAWPLPKEREGSGYAQAFLYGFFVQPFSSMPACFQAVGSLFGARAKGKGGVWLGIVAAVPVVGIVLALLLGADAVMNAFVREWTLQLRWGELFWRLFWVLGCALLFYSFLYKAAWGERPAFLQQKELGERRMWQPAAPTVVLGALLAVYAIFTYVQFVYLFGGAGLPEGLTYAQYAHEGFGQLIWVAAINFGLFAVCLCQVQDTKRMRYLLCGLLAATGVIVASAFTRIFMYICAYGFTLKRVMVVWLLAYLAAVLVACGMRLWKRKIPLLRLCVNGLALWYVVLNIVDLGGWYTG